MSKQKTFVFAFILFDIILAASYILYKYQYDSKKLLIFILLLPLFLLLNIITDYLSIPWNRVAQAEKKKSSGITVHKRSDVRRLFFLWHAVLTLHVLGFVHKLIPALVPKLPSRKSVEDDAFLESWYFRSQSYDLVIKIVLVVVIVLFFLYR